MARSSTSFKPGVSGNPSGRPKTAARYRRLLTGQVTDETFVRIVDTLIKLATEDGDTKAARILLEYCIGKPTPIEPEAEAAPAGLDVARLVAVLSDDEVRSLLDRLEQSELEASYE